MIEVVCAVIVRDGRVLLCRRPSGAHLAGHWEFPGGKVEDGETAPGALVREIREELACEVQVGEALAVVEHAYPGVEIRLRPFVCGLAGGEPEAVEHEEIGWFRPDGRVPPGLAGADEKIWKQIAPEAGRPDPLRPRTER